VPPIYSHGFLLFLLTVFKFSTFLPLSISASALSFLNEQAIAAIVPICLNDLIMRERNYFFYIFNNLRVLEPHFQHLTGIHPGKGAFEFEQAKGRNHMDKV
jgi:hypothetical protein